MSFDFKKFIDWVQGTARTPTAIFGSLLLILVIALFVFVSKSQFGQSFSVSHGIVISFIVLIGITLYFAITTKALTGQFQQRWKRSVPKSEIPRETLNELSILLDDIRRDAFAYLSDKSNADPVKLEDIRANVFLPDYRNAHIGDVCVLYMPDELRKNMAYGPEYQLRLRPGQGVAGRVFTEGARQSTRRTPEGRWDPAQHLTEALFDHIHPKLKWVVAFPVKHPKNQDTMAVLTVDGLAGHFEDDTFGRMMEEVLQEKVFRFAEKLVEHATVTIIVGVNEDD